MAANHDVSINYQYTILDMLNADCWREILGYVPIEEIIRSERVSRRWQYRMIEYMQGVNLSVEYLRPCIINILSWDRHPNSRHLTLDREDQPGKRWFEAMLTKLGENIVFIGTDRIVDFDIANIIWHCPNLEILLLCSIEYYLPLDQLKCCKRLKRISLHTCTIPDEYICQVLCVVPIEELVINNASYVSGMFLSEPKNTKLKSLTISACYLLMTDFFRTAVDLEELTKLELTLNSVEVYRNVHLLLRNTPNLEYLKLVSFDKKINVGSEFSDALSSLSKLKHFYGRYINNSHEGWLEDVAVGCKELRTLDIGNCTGVTASSVITLCRSAGPNLTELGVAWNTALTDSDLAACLKYCPNLEVLDVQGCVQVSPELVQCAVRRARPLRLRLRRTKVPYDTRSKCPWVDLDFEY
ncbi:uncharacterized protein LOC134752840 [Cydia strobilella]|uniref:uncharacterized protein LOC134752840 n=1 Tax=Cydia strobilella TaxID=1100964 RepID=UPI0030054AF6